MQQPDTLVQVPKYFAPKVNTPREILLTKELEDAFWKKVERTEPSECWVWKGALRKNGYGHLRVRGRNYLAHRISAAIFSVHLVPWLVLDHKCRNRACVNPGHLKQESTSGNVLGGVGITAQNAVKTHCPKGHEYTSRNTYAGGKKAKRRCRKCRREAQQRRDGTWSN